MAGRENEFQPLRKEGMYVVGLEGQENAHSEPRPASRRCLILANPKAGTLAAMEASAHAMNPPDEETPDSALETPPLPASLSLLAETAARVGLEAYVESIPAQADLPERIVQARSEGFDTIVAAGGDGTVHAVAQPLVGSPLRLGILPVGTANNIARALNLPFALEAALRNVAEGVERRMDVGHIAGEYFLEAAGVGLFADILREFGPDEPHRQEILRILKVCGPLCWNPRARTLRLVLDGVAQQEEALMVSVANIPYLGENMPMAPDARIDDGLLDVVIVGALTRRELVGFAFALWRGQHLEMPQVRRLRAKTVEIRRVHRSHRPLPVHADDHIAARTPAYLEAVPGALRVLTPAPDAH
jgi:diacylglycerol kinase (ATP)